jgi:hypothetical protein
MATPVAPLPVDVPDCLEGARARLRNHALYGAIRTPGALRTFAEHHVVCVLDFMSLLKSLQRDTTCVSVPWTPVRDSQAARLIQSIVLDEETDVRPDGRVMSHFEWYLEAMAEIEADTRPVRDVVGSLARGMPLAPALRASGLPSAAVEFGLTTAALLEGPLHARAAVFFHGREEIIPSMFLGILARLEMQGLPCPSLRGYLQRHVDLDGSDHGPRAEQMLARLCQGNKVMIVEAQAAALVALHARERLWEAIVSQIQAA